MSRAVILYQEMPRSNGRNSREQEANGDGIDEPFDAAAHPLRSNRHVLPENGNRVMMLNTKAG